MKANPLTESTFYILLALADEPLHGYGIIKKVEQLSSNTIVMAAGTLYGAIENLKRGELIKQVAMDEENRRKVYQISDQGLQILMNDYLRMKNLSAIAQTILERKG